MSELLKVNSSRSENISAYSSGVDLNWYVPAMERLVMVVRELSTARNIDEISVIVRDAARALTGADGATFVLRDDDNCFYADENAIAPLWKGARFPMKKCISGWVMENARSVIIEDIYADPRIPADAYRPTFVKSLAMVPIRKNSPIGAIGNYWAKKRTPTREEVAILQALADTTAVAIENSQLYTKLEAKMKALEESNYELNRFAWVASHDLQEPLRTVVTQMELLDKRYGPGIEERGRNYIKTATKAAKRLQLLISDILIHSGTDKNNERTTVNMEELVKQVIDSLQVSIHEKGASVSVGNMPSVVAEPVQIARLLQNLVSNALKFQRDTVVPVISISCRPGDNEYIFSVSDNGIGIAAENHTKIFGFFQRLNSREKYAGSGIGLATGKKIVESHGGRLWLESTVGKGSVFYFTLPANL